MISFSKFGWQFQNSEIMDIWGSNKSTSSACFPFRLQAKRHAKRAWQTQPESCLSCPNSKVLVLTADGGGCRLFSGLLYWRVPACPAVELCTKHNLYSLGKLSKNFWPHFGHFRIIRCAVLFGMSPRIAIAITFSPTGLSHNLPCLQAKHFT